MYYENWNIFNYEVEGFDIEGWMVFKICKIFFIEMLIFYLKCEFYVMIEEKFICVVSMRVFVCLIY